MEIATFVIAVSGALLSTYTFIAIRLRQRAKMRIFRFTPDRLTVDDDFNTLHVHTDADFIVTNLSDKPNTVIRMDVSANFGTGWVEGKIVGKRLNERMETRTNYGGSTGEPQRHNEVVREWVNADVCPIMLSPQASGIPNQGITLRLDFQNTRAITNLAALRVRLELYDQYGKRHRLDVGSREFEDCTVRQVPKFYDDEQEIGRLKDHIPAENMEAVVRVVYRRYEPAPAQSTLSLRRYYKLMGDRKFTNVAHFGRDGFAHDDYRPRDFQKRLREDGAADREDGAADRESGATVREDGATVCEDGADDRESGAEDGLDAAVRRELGDPDGFHVSFKSRDGLPEILHIRLPDNWNQDRLEVAIPPDFARLCVLQE